ncbi:AAA family ATPase [Nocardioides sp.]|uniref:AAA family ATPase n=1 Tax=Nocardioides sp. TaxID=35761 RepID=UPI0035275B88
MDDRERVLAHVAALLPVVRRPLLVAVDGPDGVGKTHFADALADHLRAGGRAVARSSVDDFHHPRAHRHALGRTPEAVWTRHFDYQALRRELLEPWLAGPGASYRPAWHDVARDEHVDAPRASVPEAGVLVVDGVFAQRPEITRAWDLVVFLDAPPEVTVARMAARDGSPADPEHPDQRRYLDAQRIYAEACRPRDQADVVVDNTDLDAPRLVPAADSVAEPPPGWEVDGDDLVRTVRVPRGSLAAAAAVDRLAPPPEAAENP